MPENIHPRRVALREMLPTAVPDLAAKLADLHGLGAVQIIGWPGWRPRAYPNLEAGARNVPAERSALAIDFAAGLDRSSWPAVREQIRAVPLALLRVPDPLWTSVLEEGTGSETAFCVVGRVPLDDGEAGTLAIIDRRVGPALRSKPPSDFRVLAILTTFNEADIIESTLEALRRDGVEIHIVDNWSNDETFAIATRYAELGLARVERFPATPPDTFNHAQLLRRVEEIAAQSNAAWVIHHDMDERRRPPWPDLTLRDALWTVQQSGFNAVDHTVLTFRPVDDTWLRGIDPEASITHFEVEARPDLLLQVRAWHSASLVDLARSGGHDAAFEGRRVFPYRFLLKHYPLRSQEQAERKVFRERRSRWNEEERAKGWHHHYDDIRAGQSFIWPPDGLERFVEGQSHQDFLVPFVGGAEVGQPWAVKARMAAIEGRYMGQQRANIERGLERLLGPTSGRRVARWIQGVAWVVRPLRRAVARHRWRSMATKRRSRQTPS
jgi:hypothetical protein